MNGGRSTDITFARRLGNRALNGAVNVLFGTSYTDLCYGYNAFWVRCLPALDVDCDGFEVETLINIRAARRRLRVVEVPSFERERLYGETKLRAWRDGRRVLATIARERLRNSPARIGGSRGDRLSLERPSGFRGADRRPTEREATSGSVS